MILTEEHQMIRDALRTFSQERLAPNAARWDKEHHFPKDELKELAALGAFGVAVPEHLGGAGLDYVSLALVLEEIAAGDGGTSTIISVNNCPVCSIAMMYANDAQKEQWLRPLAQGEMLGAFALTEPHTGSDASALRTTAVRDGDEYVINGTKQFITSGKYGDVAIVMAVTDKAAGKRGISAFWVPTSTPGYIVAGLEQKMGQHSSDTAQILFENCRIPAENLIGEEGQGYKIALSGLEGGRIGIASQSVGMARAAFEAALAYSRDRETFGKPIFEHQSVQFKLAEMATKIEAARQLIRHAASMKDAGLPCLKEAAMAKLFASEMAERVVLGRDAGVRRLRLRQRLPGRAHLPRRARVPDLRRHQRHPEDPDRPRAVSRGVRPGVCFRGSAPGVLQIDHRRWQLMLCWRSISRPTRTAAPAAASRCLMVWPLMTPSAASSAWSLSSASLATAYSANAHPKAMLVAARRAVNPLPQRNQDQRQALQQQVRAQIAFAGLRGEIPPADAQHGKQSQQESVASANRRFDRHSARTAASRPAQANAIGSRSHTRRASSGAR